MQPQLKFLLADIQTTNQVAASLLLAHVENKNMRFLARPGTHLGKLQAASTIESTNIIRDGKKGILIGAVIGLLGGLYLHDYQPWITTFMDVHWLTFVVITTLIGAMVSAIGAAVFGVNLMSTDLNKFKDKIASGAILMIVTAPFQRANEIRSIVSKPHLTY